RVASQEEAARILLFSRALICPPIQVAGGHLCLSFLLSLRCRSTFRSLPPPWRPEPPSSEGDGLPAQTHSGKPGLPLLSMVPLLVEAVGALVFPMISPPSSGVLGPVFLGFSLFRLLGSGGNRDLCTSAALGLLPRVAMSVNGCNFVEWREHFVSQERGSRVVHYYLEDSSGESFLAAVGTERSLRHMLYVVAEEFLQVIGIDKSGASCLKWRSRREVVDWLTSFLPKQICTRDLSNSPINVPFDAVNEPESFVNKNVDQFTRNLKGYSTSDIFWSGVSWICGKQLKHYHSFCRNGTTIAVGLITFSIVASRFVVLNSHFSHFFLSSLGYLQIHSFVLVMSEEEENHYLAYLEDMYEDKKGQKKVRVRWFHQNQEVVGQIPPPAPHPREVFITPYTQVISAECVDDLATVVTPEHYSKCLATLPYACSAGIHLCSRQYSKNKFKPFDLSSLRGYFEQPILACLDILNMSREEEEEPIDRSIVKRGSKKITNLRGHLSFMADRLSVRPLGHVSQVTTRDQTYQNLKFGLSGKKTLAVRFLGPHAQAMPPFKVDEKVELLCQDSGIRGCWFRCTVLQLSQKRVKVHYDDLQDEDGCGNLEMFDFAVSRGSWALTFKRNLSHEEVDYLEQMLSILLDYRPIRGEDVILNCHSGDLRTSKDWIKNSWMNIEVNPDILSVISSVSSAMKLSASATFAKASESGCSAMSDQEAAATLKLNSNEEVAQTQASLSGGVAGPLEIMKQVYSRKRRREEDDNREDVKRGEQDGKRTGDSNTGDSGGVDS
ncbi:hypothetical protein Taro_036490, partial [Colocasia esculenta]|nr:hypothetical protein [Colocasia esculenta]